MDIRILEISDSLSQTGLSMKERLQALSENIAECLKKRCCIYVVRENSENYFFLIAGYPLEFHGIGRKFSFKGHLPLEKVLREKKPFLIEDTETSSLLNEEQKDWARGTGTKSILFVPIVFHQREILGIIVLDIVQDEEIAEKEINLIQQVASHVAWAINNAVVYEKLKEKKAELAQAVRLATLGEEWLKLADELGNPLATIGGFARRLAELLPENDPCREKAVIIVKEVARMENWLRSHLEFGKGETVLHPHILNSLLSEAISDFEREANFPGRLLEVEYTERPTYVLANPFQLKRVFLNILRNAQEAMEGKKTEEKSIWLRTWREDKFIWLEISNFSCGERIPEEILDRIFDPFFTTKKQSAGLGLSIVYQILDLHGAEIHCRSDEEKTSFLMKFPSSL